MRLASANWDAIVPHPTIVASRRRNLVQWMIIGGLGATLSSCDGSNVLERDARQVPVALSAPGSVEYRGDDGEALHQVISGAIVSSGVVLAERGSLTLRFYDSSGTLVRATGGRGDGPGEFRDILWLRRLSDRLAVYDPTLRRMTEVEFDGDLLQDRTVVLPEIISGADLMGMFGDGTAIAGVLRHNFPPTRVGAYRHRAAAYRIRFDPEAADSLFSMLAEDQFISGGRPTFMGPLPFGAPSWISVADTVAYAVDNVTASVEMWSISGAHIGELRVPEARRQRVTDADISLARSRFRELTKSTRGDWMRFFDAMPIPDSTPYYGWGGEAPIRPLVATPSGYVFVTLYGGVRERSTRIAVFDPRRHLLGTLMFDVEARVLDAREGMMLVQSWDSDGVEAVKLVKSVLLQDSTFQ